MDSIAAGRIYVAGHGGLIGSAVARVFRAHGCANLLLRSRSELDLADTPAVDAFFHAERPSHVVLAAGRVGGITINRDAPAEFITENLAMQLNVVRAAHRAGVQRLIFFGSSCMYPRDARQPMEESLLLAGRPEETSIAYAISKLAGMELCLSYNRQYGGQRFVPIIPNSVYGPGDDFDPATGHVLSALVGRFHDATVTGAASVVVWGSGAPRREFIYADDVAEACWMLLNADLAGTPLPLNVGVGQDISIRELAELVARIVGFRGSIEWDRTKPDGAPRKLLESSRVRALGWQPRVTLEEGIRRTLRWYLDTLLAKETT